MKNGKIALIILSKILEMPLEKYLTYINKKTSTESTAQAAAQSQYERRMAERKKNAVFAMIALREGKLTFEIPDLRLANMVRTDHKKPGDNGIVALKWINTRNGFSKHILCSLIQYQSEFWRSGKEIDLKPLTLSQFISLYPFKHLDQSRLSRLLSVLFAETPHTEVIGFRNLFPSKKRCCAYRIRAIINKDQNNTASRDTDIQNMLARQGVYLSLRTICNCRKLLGMPNYKERLSHYYGKNIRFSDYIRVSKGQFSRIPSEPGIYELSIANKVQYSNYRCDVLYIGSSKNIRKRLSNYSGSKTKNVRLKLHANGSDLFVRYFLSENHVEAEKELLKHFKKTYGELPKANKLGG
jgi:hypothetical protein